MSLLRHHVLFYLLLIVVATFLACSKNSEAELPADMIIYEPNKEFTILLNDAASEVCSVQYIVEAKYPAIDLQLYFRALFNNTDWERNSYLRKIPGDTYNPVSGVEARAVNLNWVKRDKTTEYMVMILFTSDDTVTVSTIKFPYIHREVESSKYNHNPDKEDFKEALQYTKFKQSEETNISDKNSPEYAVLNLLSILNKNKFGYCSDPQLSPYKGGRRTTFDIHKHIGMYDFNLCDAQVMFSQRLSKQEKEEIINVILEDIDSYRYIIRKLWTSKKIWYSFAPFNFFLRTTHVNEKKARVEMITTLGAYYYSFEMEKEKDVWKIASVETY